MTEQERRALQAAMARLADGERAAFEPVFAALWPLLRSFSTRLLGERAAGEDAAQTALCKLFERAQEWTHGRDPVAWALGIAAWECRTAQKKRARRREVAAPDAELASRESDPEALAVLADLRVAALEAVGTLSAQDIETLACLARGERPDLPAATFRKRISRALSRLRSAWKELHGLD